MSIKAWIAANPTAIVGFVAILNQWFLYSLGKRQRSTEALVAKCKESPKAKADVALIQHSTKVVRYCLVLAAIWLAFLLAYALTFTAFATMSAPVGRIEIILVSVVSVLAYNHIRRAGTVYSYCRLAVISFGIGRMMRKQLNT